MAKKRRGDGGRCVDRALEVFEGNGAELGRRLGVSRQQISFWKQAGRFPAKHALLVQSVTGGAVRAMEVLLEADGR